MKTPASEMTPRPEALGDGQVARLVTATLNATPMSMIARATNRKTRRILRRTASPNVPEAMQPDRVQVSTSMHLRRGRHGEGRAGLDLALMDDFVEDVFQGPPGLRHGQDVAACRPHPVQHAVLAFGRRARRHDQRLADCLGLGRHLAQAAPSGRRWPAHARRRSRRCRRRSGRPHAPSGGSCRRAGWRPGRRPARRRTVGATTGRSSGPRFSGAGSGRGCPGARPGPGPKSARRRTASWGR